MESHTRSITKAVTYRFFGSLATAAIVYLFTSNAKASMGAGALDSVIKIALYFIHERLWDMIPFGRAKRPEYEI